MVVEGPRLRSVNYSMNAMRMAVVLVGLVMVLSTFSMAVLAIPKERDSVEDTSGEYVPGELLIKFKDSASDDNKKAAKAAVKAKDIKTFKLTGAKHWKLGKDMTVENALKELGKKKYDGTVEYAEPNYYVYADIIPDDPLRGDLWGMHNIGQTGGTKDADIDALEAWLGDYTGSATIVVAIIDSGIDYDHEDLAANIWENPRETGLYGEHLEFDRQTDGIDNDNNGYIDDWRGWDFVNDDNDPMDDYGHGTHCAGTIGAVGNNGKGVVGVCWNVKLLPIKFLNSRGSGTMADCIAAQEYVAGLKDGSGDNYVRVTSNSYGGSKKSRTEEVAIKNTGALCVCSAGNGATSRKSYPAGYALDNIISVAATDHNDNLASFSNFGTWVDLAAPGVNVLSCLPGDDYGYYSGTSMACPHVSGAAAFLMSYTTKTNADVKTQLMSTVDKPTSLSGKVVSNGRLNVRAAMGANEMDLDIDVPGTVTNVVPGTTTYFTIPLTWVPTQDDGASGGACYVYDVRYRKGTTFADGDWDDATQATGEPVPTTGVSESFTLSGLEWNQPYAIRIKAADEVGNWGAASPAIVATTDGPDYSYTIDDDIDPDTESFYQDMALDKDGNPVIAYCDVDKQDVKLAWWNGNSWDIQTVDSGKSVHTGISVDLDPNGDPGISYGWKKLYYSHWNPDTQSWDREVVETGPRNDVTSLVFDSAGNPHIAYYGGGSLKHATKSSGSWTITTVDQGAGAKYKDIALDGSGNPMIVYSDDADGDGWLDSAKFARYSGGQWNIEDLDTGARGTGIFTTVAIAGDGEPSVVYQIDYGTTADVVYRHWDVSSSSWSTAETIYSAQYPGDYCLAFNSDGVPYVSFSEGGKVRLAYKAESVWEVEIVGPGCNYVTSLHLDGNDDVHISYTVSRVITYTVRD